MCVKASIYKAGKCHFLRGGNGKVTDHLLAYWALPLSLPGVAALTLEHRP